MKIKYSLILKDLADQIENLRIEIYSKKIIDDKDDNMEFTNLLFSIQNKLRYDAKKIIECYEEEDL